MNDARHPGGKDDREQAIAGASRPQHLRLLWENLHTSFWFVPGTMVLLALALSWLAHLADEWLAGGDPSELPFVFYVSMPDDARSVLSTLLSSMITMTSLVFSITMVVLTLAASQFGPRLIRSFMANPYTQLVLGTFVMTTVYCLVTLGTVGSRSGEQLQVFTSVSLAIALALISLAVLVWFLHLLARSIVSETVIDRLGRELNGLLDELEPLSSERQDEPEEALPDDYDEKARFFGPLQDGYVEAVEFKRLVGAAAESDVTVGVHFRPGDYVAVDGGGIGIYPGDRCSDELIAAVQKAILVGPHRTPTQDPEFAIRHLVEIAVRALSPGINDPYTATAVIGQLSASLSRLMGRALPEGVLKDEDGMVRVIYPRPTYASLIGTAFNQIRQHASAQPMVLIHMLEAITRIAEHAKLNVQRKLLEQQVKVIVAAAHRDIKEEADIAAVDERAVTARKVLKRGRLRLVSPSGQAREE